MKKLIKIRGDKDFTKWRGGDISRLEAFTDAVFAIAITLLVVTQDIPRNNSEFTSVMWGFFGFGFTFFALTCIWYNNFKFHRRFGLEDGYTIFLNSMMIFMVLFYIYPLKFMAQIVINFLLLKNSFGIEFDIGFEGNVDVNSLFIICGMGVFLIWFILGLMYLHAYKKRTILELDEKELEITTGTILANFIVCLVALFSVLLAFYKLDGWPGWVYFLIAPLIFFALFFKEKYFKSV
jgi:uncharacterized membrane protein